MGPPFACGDLPDAGPTLISRSVSWPKGGSAVGHIWSRYGSHVSPSHPQASPTNKTRRPPSPIPSSHLSSVRHLALRPSYLPRFASNPSTFRPPPTHNFRYHHHFACSVRSSLHHELALNNRHWRSNCPSPPRHTRQHNLLGCVLRTQFNPASFRALPLWRSPDGIGPGNHTPHEPHTINTQ